VFVSIVAWIFNAMRKAKNAPPRGVDEEWLVHLRPPVSIGFLEDLAARSGGRLAWERGNYGASLEAFGVSVWFGGRQVCNRIVFMPDFNPVAWVDSIRIGMPLEELRRRYRTLQRDPADPHDDIMMKLESGPDGIHRYAGAMTASGHELSVRVKHGKVESFAIAVPGWWAADKALRVQDLAGKKEAKRKVEEHQARERRFLGNLATTAEEDDAMLDHWATEDKRGPGLAAFLREADPDERHAVAASWNWDNGMEPLFWILRRPDCDKATALTILSMAEADYYLRHAGGVEDIPASERAGFWLCSEILDRWERGFYLRAEIAYAAPDGEFANFLDRAGQVRAAPASMTMPLPGRKVSTRGHREGFPPHRGRPDRETT
jgi:hypothetical protein